MDQKQNIINGEFKNFINSMMEQNIINGVINSMIEFQKQNNIKEQCITNSQYLYDVIKKTFPHANVKAKAVCVISDDERIFEHNKRQIRAEKTVIGGHVVLFYNDVMIDSSYEISCLKAKSYFDNIKELMNNTKMNDDTKKFTISNHLKCMKFAEEINNGKLVITSKEYYNNLADYMDNIQMRIFTDALDGLGVECVDLKKKRNY